MLISFNDNLDKSFVKDLSSKLFEWTGQRWIITFSKLKGEDTLKKKEQNVLTKKNILSKEEFQEEISGLREKVKKYQNERNEKINSLTKKRLSSMEVIIKNLSPILAEYSKENNISIIMDKKNIIVGKTELDITKKILVLLDDKIKKIEF